MTIFFAALPCNAAATVKVGSKKFTENVILGEIASLLSRNAGVETIHVKEMGGTRILWNGLKQGEIDIYPEYTGTIAYELLGIKKELSFGALQQKLAEHGLKTTGPLGFNNTYVIGMTKDLARRRKIATISDLRHHPELRFGFSHEFLDRPDGWPGLKQRYDLPQRQVSGLDHDLAYRGIAAGSLDAIDLYATDAEIRYYNLQTIKDDKNYFPSYEAVFLYRADLAERYPAVQNALLTLTGKIDEETMVSLNAAAKLDKVPASKVAADFLKDKFGINSHLSRSSKADLLMQYTRQHLILVGISLGFAVVVGMCLGLIAVRYKRLSQGILGIAGLIQTIPSLALLVFMIPLFGIGPLPAIFALFFYSLLPIVRNTYLGFSLIPGHLIESAVSLGLAKHTRFFWVELPLAAKTILAGIKTAAVINIGTATLGALIGAGGYGEPILTGIRLDDMALILLGAIPAAVMALLAQGLFEGLERFLVSKGLQLTENHS